MILFYGLLKLNFIIHTFAFKLSLDAVLTQKDLEGNESPIYFMSTNLEDEKLNYPFIEK